jgi:hypothetical protein
LRDVLVRADEASLKRPARAAPGPVAVSESAGWRGKERLRSRGCERGVRYRNVVRARGTVISHGCEILATVSVRV